MKEISYRQIRKANIPLEFTLQILRVERRGLSPQASPALSHTYCLPPIKTHQPALIVRYSDDGNLGPQVRRMLVGVETPSYNRISTIDNYLKRLRFVLTYAGTCKYACGFVFAAFTKFFVLNSNSHGVIYIYIDWQSFNPTHSLTS